MWRDVKAGDMSSRESWQVWPHLDAEERKKVVGPQAQEALLNRLRQSSIMLNNMLIHFVPRFAKKYEGITGEACSSPCEDLCSVDGQWLPGDPRFQPISHSARCPSLPRSEECCVPGARL